MHTAMHTTMDKAEISEIMPGRAADLRFPPGALLATDHGVFTHYGIAGDRLIDGQQSVISSSWRRGGTFEESLRTFANGHEVVSKGFIGNLSAHDILGRARADIGRRWDFARNNCEHHVTRACGLKPRSPQLRRAAVSVAAIAVLVLVPPLRVAVLKGWSLSA